MGECNIQMDFWENDMFLQKSPCIWKKSMDFWDNDMF
jgi:hypothetical protein